MRHAYSRPVSEELVSQTIELPRGELRLLQPEESAGRPDDGEWAPVAPYWSARTDRARPRSRRGSVLVRDGKGGRRREIGMDPWGWEQLRPWLAARVKLPVGPLFCIIDGPTRGRPWSSAGVRVELRHLAVQAGARRRFAPHQLRHAHALELAREGVPLNIIQRQLGHANLGTTSIYLQGIDTEGIIATVHASRATMMSATAGLRL
jgi:integrase